MSGVLDVLIVDDDEAIRRAYMLFLKASGLTVEAESNALAAIRRLEKGPVLVVVTDETMQGPAGTVLLETVMRRWPATGRVLFTGTAGVERKALAARALVLSKGDRPGDVRRAIIAEVQDAERRHRGPI
ncbi:MAG TPA: response regulator [Candidatus Krumholzibacteria bacterium]